MELGPKVEKWIMQAEGIVARYDRSLDKVTHGWARREPFVGSLLQETLYERLTEGGELIKLLEGMIQRLSFDVGNTGYTEEWRWTKDAIISVASHFTAIERIVELYEVKKGQRVC